MERTFRTPVRVVFYRDEDDPTIWIAYCLEFNLIGHGEIRGAAIEMLDEAITIQATATLQSGNSSNLFSPAPAEYQGMYARGGDLALDEFKIDDVSSLESRL